MAYEYDNESPIAESLVPVVVYIHINKTVYLVDSCIMCPFFICKTSDLLTVTQPLIDLMNEFMNCRHTTILRFKSSQYDFKNKATSGHQFKFHDK